MQPSVDCGAVPQSIHEREDAYRVAEDDVHLPQPGVWLFLIWRESFATQLGSNQLMTNVSIISICQIAAQQGQSQTMTAEFVAGVSQFLLMSFDAQRSEQLRTGIPG